MGLAIVGACVGALALLYLVLWAMNRAAHREFRDVERFARWRETLRSEDARRTTH